MGITFFVDPAIAEDKNLDHVTAITLSYTMFPADPPEEKPVAARAGGNERGQGKEQL